MFPKAGLTELNGEISDAVKSGASGLLTHTLHVAMLPLKTEPVSRWGKVWSAMRGGEEHPAVELVATRKDGAAGYVEASAGRWLSDARIFVTVIFRYLNQRRAAEEAFVLDALGWGFAISPATSGAPA